MSPDDEYCEEYFRKTVRRNSAGRYIVSLPIRPQYDSLACLGSSRPKAYRQFLRNEASLLRNPSLKLNYDAVLLEYESLGHMARVNFKDVREGDSYYLPHHAVLKPESSSTKVRVLFNASSKTSCRLSLNDTLFTGPVLQNDLRLLIVRWCFYRCL